MDHTFRVEVMVKDCILCTNPKRYWHGDNSDHGCSRTTCGLDAVRQVVENSINGLLDPPLQDTIQRTRTYI